MRKFNIFYITSEMNIEGMAKIMTIFDIYQHELALLKRESEDYLTPHEIFDIMINEPDNYYRVNGFYLSNQDSRILIGGLCRRANIEYKERLRTDLFKKMRFSNLPKEKVEMYKGIINRYKKFSKEWG